MTEDSVRLGEALAGSYRVERELGAGGMATVYLARDLRHDRDVAIKVLHEGLAQSLGRERFVREIHLAARLSHPHILPLYDSGEAGGYLFYVMPVMQGQTLRDRLFATGTIPTEEAVRIATEIADALDYAHRNDVVHRDIKPENILLHEGHAIVGDFGIGKALMASVGETKQFTQARVALGTPAYMSPEQAAGDDVDGRSDLFSLGCVLYEMLTGYPPFTGPTMEAVIGKRFHYTPPPLTSTHRRVPTGVSRTVERLLERAPGQRLSSGATVVKALRGEQELAAKPATPSVAVLPFANMSSDADNAFFSDGITDDIIGALTKVTGLRVAARASAFTFRGADVDLGVVGDKLGVRHVLQGSVRRAGNRVRVTAQLMAAQDRTQLWSERWDRELDDIFAIQDEIARAIVGELELRLGVKESQAPLIARPTDDMEAYELFLRGRESVRRRTPTTIRSGIDALRYAIIRDPKFALAWLGMAEAQAALSVYGYDSLKNCRAIAEEALARAKGLGASEADLARYAIIVKLYMSLDWFRAGDDLEVALRLCPHDAFTNAMASLYHGLVGNKRALAATTARVVSADPLSAWSHSMVGHSWFMAGNLVLALESFQTALAIDANSLAGSWGSAFCHSHLGAHDDAIRLARRAAEIGERTAGPLSMLALVLSRAGAHEEAQAVAREVIAKAPEHGHASLIAEVLWADDARLTTLLDHAIEAEAGAITLGTTIGPVLRQLLEHPVHGARVRRLSLFSHMPPHQHMQPPLNAPSNVFSGGLPITSRS